jgi:predicted transcriptional regulator
VKNITITLDDDTARWVRQKAADQSKSVSRYIGDLIHQYRQDQVAYQRAMERWLAKPPYALREPGDRPTLRDEIYVGPRTR